MSRRRAGQGLGVLADDAAERAVYVVSVAAELAGMHPQTLRQYDRLGLGSPARTRGRGRPSSSGSSPPPPTARSRSSRPAAKAVDLRDATPRRGAGAPPELRAQ